MKIFSPNEIQGLVALFKSVEDNNPQASLGSSIMHELYAGAVLASLQRAAETRMAGFSPKDIEELKRLSADTRVSSELIGLRIRNAFGHG